MSYYTILNFSCVTLNCPFSALAALAITEAPEPIVTKCTPRCPYCAQLTQLVDRVHDELHVAEAIAKAIDVTDG